MASEYFPVSKKNFQDNVLGLLNQGKTRQTERVQYLREKISLLEQKRDKVHAEKRVLQKELSELKKEREKISDMRQNTQWEERVYLEARKQITGKQRQDKEHCDKQLRLLNRKLEIQKEILKEDFFGYRLPRIILGCETAEAEYLKNKIEGERKARKLWEQKHKTLQDQLNNLTGNLKTVVHETEGDIIAGNLKDIPLEMEGAANYFSKLAVLSKDNDISKALLMQTEDSSSSTFSTSESTSSSEEPSPPPKAVEEMPEAVQIYNDRSNFIYSSFCSGKTLLETEGHALDNVKEKKLQRIFCICGVEFGTMDNIATHVDFFVSGCVFPCVYCNETFEKSELLETHQMRQHYDQNYEKLPHLCDSCGLAFEPVECYFHRRYNVAEIQIGSTNRHEGRCPVELAGLGYVLRAKPKEVLFGWMCNWELKSAK